MTNNDKKAISKYPNRSGQLISYDQYIKSQDMSYDYVFKCIIVGNSGVGKSSLLLQYTENKFIFDHEMTIGVEFGSRTIDINGKKIKLQIWDTAGQETFRSITRSYYRESSSVLLVYDVTNSTSFVSLGKWLNDINGIANNPHIILIGNKADLTYRRQVSFEEGKKFADDNGMLFIETCANKIDSVNDAFMTIAKRTLEAIQKGEIDINDLSRGIKIGLLNRLTNNNKTYVFDTIDLSAINPDASKNKSSNHCCW